MARARSSALTLVVVLGLAAPAAGATYNTGLSSWVIAGKLAYDCGAPPVCSDGPDALSGRFTAPGLVAVDAAGAVYVPDHDDHLVRRVAPDGALTTLTTDGTFATVRSASDHPLSFTDKPTSVAVTPDASTLFVAVESGGHNGQVLRVANGAVSVYAGTGADCSGTCGDDGAATAATITDAEGLALDSAGSLYIADAGANRVRRVGTDGKISTVAGSATACSTPTDGANCGDGGAATAAQLAYPSGLAVSANGGTLFIADSDDNRVRQVVGGTITTVAGTGATPCSCGDVDNGPATATDVALVPHGISVDGSGNLLIADPGGSRFRRVTPDGTITTIAGGGVTPGFGGQATAVAYPGAASIVPEADGSLVASDSLMDQIYWLVPSKPLGIPGPKGDKGDTGPAGAAGAMGPIGPTGGVGPAGAHGGDSPLLSWSCRKRRRGIGRNAVNCYARVFADDGAHVRARLSRKGRTIATDSGDERDGLVKLHFGSRTRVRGAFVLKITERSSSGVSSDASVRVAI